MSWDYVGAYWGPRQETALECGRRAELFFQLLARCDPSFTQWYRGGRKIPRGLPGHPVQTQAEDWEPVLLRSRARTDVGDKLIEDLGFREIVLNDKKLPTLINFHCGGYSPWGGPNSCVLRPPMRGEIRERLWTVPVMTQVLTCMVTAWDPDFAMVTSTTMVELLEKEDFAVRVGWLTYLSRRLGHLPPLPAPVRIEPVGSQGWLLTLSSAPMTADNPEHVAFTARVRELLDRAGLIVRPQAPPHAW